MVSIPYMGKVRDQLRSDETGRLWTIKVSIPYMGNVLASTSRRLQDASTLFQFPIWVMYKTFVNSLRGAVRLL